MSQNIFNCKMRLLIVLSLCTVLSSTVSAVGCSVGDTECFCKSIGGSYRSLASPSIPACRLYYQHQGAERYAHVYLPKGYDGVTTFPLWLQLHGVFWNTMGGIGNILGAINGTDIIPVWDRAVSLFGDQAIFVYPQSTGYAGTGNEANDGQGVKYRQFWNVPFWHCSIGVCSDARVDDVGFIEKVLLDVQSRLAVTKGQTLLTGLSAGGMMVEALLCQSKVIPRVITASIDILGGIAKDYAYSPNCQNAIPVPYMKLQGKKDPFITYDKDILVDGVNFMAAVDLAKFRAKKAGCSPSDAGSYWTAFQGELQCVDLCKKKAGAGNVIRLCGMTNVGHDTDHPWPGFVYERSWKFFQDVLKQRQQRQNSGMKSGGAAAVATEAARDGRLNPTATWQALG